MKNSPEKNLNNKMNPRRRSIRCAADQKKKEMNANNNIANCCSKRKRHAASLTFDVNNSNVKEKEESKNKPPAQQSKKVIRNGSGVLIQPFELKTISKRPCTKKKTKGIAKSTEKRKKLELPKYPSSSSSSDLNSDSDDNYVPGKRIVSKKRKILSKFKKSKRLRDHVNRVVESFEGEDEVEMPLRRKRFRRLRFFTLSSQFSQASFLNGSQDSQFSQTGKIDIYNGIIQQILLLNAIESQSQNSQNSKTQGNDDPKIISDDTFSESSLPLA